MASKWLGVALLAVSAAASSQTIYRTVTGDGKVVYSDAPVANGNAVKPNQVKTYAAEDLGAANSMPEPGGGDSACRGDIRKFCSQAQGQQAQECLLDHQQDISDACYDALKKKLQSGRSEQDGQGNAPPGAQACRQDAQQFCKGVQPGGGRIVNCLLEHQKDLSDACYDTLSKRKQGGR